MRVQSVRLLGPIFLGLVGAILAADGYFNTRAGAGSFLFLLGLVFLLYSAVLMVVNSRASRAK